MADETAAVLEREATGDAAEEQEATKLAENAEERDDAETNGAETETENEEAEALTKEDLEKALKDQKAKLEESFRQKAENDRREATEAANAATYAQRLTSAQQSLNGQSFQELGAIVKTATDQGLEAIPTKWLADVATRLGDAAFVSQHDLYASFIKQQFASEFDGYRIPNEIQSRMEAATRAFAPQEQVKAWFAAMVAAVRETETPKLKKELQKAADTAHETTKLKASTDERKTAVRPTGDIPVAAGGKGLTVAQIEAMPMSEWLAIGRTDKDGGKERRARIRDEARVRAAR